MGVEGRTSARKYLTRLREIAGDVLTPLRRLSEALGKKEGAGDEGEIQQGRREEIEAVTLDSEGVDFANTDWEFRPGKYVYQRDRENIKNLCQFFLELLENLQQFATVFLAFLAEAPNLISGGPQMSIEASHLKDIRTMVQFLFEHSPERGESLSGPWLDLENGVEALDAIEGENGKIIRPDELFEKVIEARSKLRDLFKNGSLDLLERIPPYTRMAMGTGSRGPRHKTFLLLTQWLIYKMQRDLHRKIEDKRKELNTNTTEAGHGMDPVRKGDLEVVLDKLVETIHPEAPQKESVLEFDGEEPLSVTDLVRKAYEGEFFIEDEEDPADKKEKEGFVALVKEILTIQKELRELKLDYESLEMYRQVESEKLDRNADEIEARITSKHFSGLFDKKGEAKKR